jgi:hypothetical protein
MGRLTNFFRKVGHGIRRGLHWIGENVLPVARRIVDVAKNPAVRGLISQIPVVGAPLAGAIGAVDTGLGVAERLRDRFKPPAPAAPAPPRRVIPPRRPPDPGGPD